MATAAPNQVKEPVSKSEDYRFPPGFQRNLLWFAFRRFRPANPIVLFQHLVDEYGDIAHYKIGWNHIVFLNNPDYIREVLVVQNDNFIKERTVRVTYDASRLKQDAVAKMLRQAGVDIGESMVLA